MTEQQLRDRFNRIVNKESYATLEEIEQEQNEYSFGDHVMADVSLDSIIDDLLYNGLQVDEINTMMSNIYGNVIEVYYLNEDEMYCVLVGSR